MPPLPALCFHPSLPEKTIAMLQEVWETQPPQKRHVRTSLPPSEWESILTEGHHCFVTMDGSDKVLLPQACFYPDLSLPDATPEFKPFVDRQTLVICFDLFTPLPAVGDTLHISKIGGTEDIWATLVAGLLIELGLGGSHTKLTLERNGLSLTDGYVNEVEHWVEGKVLVQNRTERTIDLLLKIEVVSILSKR